MPDPTVLVAAAVSGLAAAVLLHRPSTGRLAVVMGASSRPPHDSSAGADPRAAGRAPALPARPGRPGRSGGVRGNPGAADRHALAACLVLAGACLLVPPLAAGVPAAAMAVLLGPQAVGRLEPAEQRRRRARLRADLPLLLDLLAACLAGGAAPASAAAAVSTAVGGPAGERLALVAAALRVGTPASDAWAALAGSAPDDDPLGPASRALSRAAEGGAPVAAAVSRLAGEARARALADGEQAARRAGVLAVAPLGLCFLPAFVLLGVVPVVAGLARPLLATF